MGNGPAKHTITERSLGLLSVTEIQRLPKPIPPTLTLFDSNETEGFTPKADPAGFPILAKKVASLLMEHYRPFVIARNIWEREADNGEKVSPSRICGFMPHLTFPELQPYGEQGNFSAVFEKLRENRVEYLIRGFEKRLSAFVEDLLRVHHSSETLSTWVVPMPEQAGQEEDSYWVMPPIFGAGHLGKELHVLAREIWFANAAVSLEGDYVRVSPDWRVESALYEKLLMNIFQAIEHGADIDVPTEEKIIVVDDALTYSKDH